MTISDERRKCISEIRNVWSRNDVRHVYMVRVTYEMYELWVSKHASCAYGKNNMWNV